MFRIVNECVDCGIPCAGYACGLRRAARACCDKCGRKAAVFYRLSGRVLCERCIGISAESAEPISSEALEAEFVFRGGLMQ